MSALCVLELLLNLLLFGLVIALAWWVITGVLKIPIPPHVMQILAAIVVVIIAIWIVSAGDICRVAIIRWR